jgi:deoxyribonuclease-4
MTTTFYYGFHESIKGGIPAAIDRVMSLRCTAMQVFLGTPYATSQKALKLGDAVATKQKLTTPFRLFVHGPYTVNFAKPPDQTQWQLELVRELCRGAHQHGAEGVVFHMGKHTKLPRDQGMANMLRSVREIVKHPEFQGRLLLETAAGQGTELCWRWPEFAEFYQSLQGCHDRLGVCLDTCHLFAAGHDVTDRKFLDQMAEDLGGSHHIRLIHLNDSKGPKGCRKDRHEKIGQGHIGLEGLQTVIRWARDHGIPLVLETKPPWEPQLDTIVSTE